MLLGVTPAKLRAVGLRTASRPKFNMHAFTGSSICKGVVLRFTIARKFTGFCRLIYCIGLRPWMDGEDVRRDSSNIVLRGLRF
jgi:hypothetical protein